MTAQLWAVTLNASACPGQLTFAIPITMGATECWICGNKATSAPPTEGRPGQFCSPECADDHSATFRPPSDDPGTDRVPN